MKKKIRITIEDFVLESDPTIKEDFRDFCIVIKQVKKDYKLATKLRDEILQGLLLLDIVREKYKTETQESQS